MQRRFDRRDRWWDIDIARRSPLGQMAGEVEEKRNAEGWFSRVS